MFIADTIDRFTCKIKLSDAISASLVVVLEKILVLRRVRVLKLRVYGIETIRQNRSFEEIGFKKGLFRRENVK